MMPMNLRPLELVTRPGAIEIPMPCPWCYTHLTEEQYAAYLLWQKECRTIREQTPPDGAMVLPPCPVVVPHLVWTYTQVTEMGNEWWYVAEAECVHCERGFTLRLPPIQAHRKGEHVRVGMRIEQEPPDGKRSTKRTTAG